MEKGTKLDPRLKDRLLRLARALMDQEKARVLVPPQRGSDGFWFGGGNMTRAPDGSVLLVGRYRNCGDSRTGLAAGVRGLELSIFGAVGPGGPFEKVGSFSKRDLTASGAEVLSIEGAALHWANGGLEVFVSSEKDLPYPDEVKGYRKPGTGVWSIDVFGARDVAGLDPSSKREVLSSTRPEALHVKDPVVFDAASGETAMVYCSHPFAWSSSNTGLAVRSRGGTVFRRVTECLLRRGTVWDVAVTRVTDRLPVPRLGAFKDLPPLALYFYDGAECVRSHRQHARGVVRPRGYSCEEIGGLAWGFEASFPRMERLSVNAPLFVSPRGTGSSRYVGTFVAGDAIWASWQQSQDDLSQPLVGHCLPMEEVERLLS